MSNVAGKAYAMNVLTPMPVRWTWVNRFLFMVSRVFPSFLGELLALRLIHFARWVMIKRNQWPEGERGPSNLQHDYMLFCSNFNGTWDQYIDAFADGLPSGLDLFWYSSIKFPHSIPITPFKKYIVFNQFDTNYYYNATPGSAQRDIKLALMVKTAVDGLVAAHKTMEPAQFALAYRKALASVQNCLASPGYAPIASRDTWNADKNRIPFVAKDKTVR